MNKDWQNFKLGEIFKTVTGNTPPKANSIFFGDFIPLIKPPELLDNTLDSGADGLSKAGAEVARVLPPNSILVSCIGNLGKVGLNTVDVAINQQINAILPNNGIAIPRFVFYQAISSSFQDQLHELATGTTLPIVNKSKFNSIKVVLPAITEQQRIVSILDKAFDGIATAKANAEKNLQNARELFESYLESVFTERGDGWVKRPFSDVCEIVSSLIDPQLEPYLNMEHVGGANIESKTGLLIDMKTSKEEGLKSGKFCFDETMVLYSKIRPYLMKVARPNFKGLCSADIYPLFPNPKYLNRDFLFYMLLTDNFTRFAVTGSARAGMPKVNRNHLFSYEGYMPPIDEQLRLVKQLDSMSSESKRLESLYQVKLRTLDQLKQSFLHQAFSGRL